MKLGKSLLLGSAAVIASTIGGQAADLPVRKAAPVDYVRVCDWTGTGFFYIPGTDTCIQIGGRVFAEGAFINNANQFFPTTVVGAQAQSGAGNVNGVQQRVIGAGTFIPGRREDTSGFQVQGRLAADVRTQTAYGTLRTFVRYAITRVQGLYAGGGVAGGANTFSNQGGNNVTLDKGFIQFAGITAGRTQSFFDFYADNYNFEGIANSDAAQNLFAYTYQVGGGLSATLSIESHEGRTGSGIGTITGGAFEVGGNNQGATALLATYGGSTIPDIVGQVNYTQAWGQAQLSAAYHEVNTIIGPFAGTSQGFASRDADGFAVQAGVQIKLPMLAAGDDIWVQGAYQEGAYLYQDSGAYANAGFNSRYLGGFQHIDRDAIAIGVPGSPTGAYNLSLSRGFSVAAAFSHYFTATFQDVLFGSYEEAGYGRAKNIDWTLGGLGDFSEYRIGNQFVFTPVKNLAFTAEFDYAHIDQTLARNPGANPTALPTGVALNPDAFEARLRIERDF